MKTSTTLLILMILTTLTYLSKLISTKTTKSKNLNSPFECGFSNQMNHITIMSHNFFSFTIMFLILELEIILIFPFTENPKKDNILSWMFIIMITTILTMMTMEWSNKMIEWNK